MTLLYLHFNNFIKNVQTQRGKISYMVRDSKLKMS